MAAVKSVLLVSRCNVLPFSSSSEQIYCVLSLDSVPDPLCITKKKANMPGLNSAAFGKCVFDVEALANKTR